VDTFIDTLKTRHKLNIINHALNSARKNNQKITNSRKVFEQRQKNIYKHQIHWHKKLTLAFACIIFFFIGAPLGSIIRKGGLGTPLVISVIFFIIYYIISITGENFVEKGVLPAFFGMWLSSLIFLPIGIFLTYKATNDSMILNTETYAKAIKKIISFGSFKNGKSGEDDAKNFSEQ
jgi:lipopolysaccharide export system permease protein